MKLYVVDDFFPLMLSSFRIAEYNWYLRSLPECYVFSTFRDFKAAFRKYHSMFPYLSDRVRHMVDLVGRPDLYYTVFINNAYDFQGIFEAGGTPFSFTLYPGGGLHLEESDCDAKLERVGASGLLNTVITTQTTTRDYVLQKGFFPEEKVHFIYGGVLNSHYFEEHFVQHRKYGQDKGTFDICFVATRYDPRGVSKGYDVFLEVARRLLPYHPDIMFHIVGETWFDVDDELDTSFLGDRVVEYGSRDLPFFPEFHSGMDMIVSPNKPFSHPIHPGAFDGFPTGCCMEAGMCGTAVLCTDLLNNNVAFTDGEDIRIIPYDMDGICDIVVDYFNDLDSLYKLGENCRSSFLRILGVEAQMSQRMQVLGLPEAL